MALLIDQVNCNSECSKAFDDLEEGNVEAMRINLRLCKQKLENMINKVIDGPIGLVKKSGRHSSAGQSRSSRSRCTNVMSLKISRKRLLRKWVTSRRRANSVSKLQRKKKKTIAAQLTRVSPTGCKSTPKINWATVNAWSLKCLITGARSTSHRRSRSSRTARPRAKSAQGKPRLQKTWAKASAFRSMCSTAASR